MGDRLRSVVGTFGNSHRLARVGSVNSKRVRRAFWNRARSILRAQYQVQTAKSCVGRGAGFSSCFIYGPATTTSSF